MIICRNKCAGVRSEYLWSAVNLVSAVFAPNAFAVPAFATATPSFILTNCNKPSIRVASLSFLRQKLVVLLSLIGTRLVPRPPLPNGVPWYQIDTFGFPLFDSRAFFALTTVWRDALLCLGHGSAIRRIRGGGVGNQKSSFPGPWDSVAPTL